ncbi:hypothetical protein LCGC14_1280970 [marine sediment metagenome]|uniref:Nucleotide exchange factor GrpE n=1 Tax=marine sediment metagenome TaxID=412755 RepID=A0A0F9KWU3_9ZZZZ
MAEEKEEKQELNNNNDQTESSEETNTLINNTEVDLKSIEIKQLEEKEHYELDYFSKDEILEKSKKLEKQVAEFKEKINKLLKENSDSKNKHMHLQAEFENAQKRWKKNRQNLRIEYTASVLKNFLPLYDSFKKAIENAKETEKNLLTNFYNQFMNIYKSYGAEPIPIKINDPFDYTKHEALSSLEKDDIPENTILELIQDGFKYDKEIIRYAKVIVSRQPKPPEPEPEEKEVEEAISEVKEPEEKEVKEATSEVKEPQEDKTGEKKTSKKKRKDKKSKKIKE